MPPLLEKVDEFSPSPIQKFYAGSSIFVTGATGFLGRLLVEKLLRSCPEITNIFLLVRAKKNKEMSERLEELFECPIFDRLKEDFPKFRHKVVGIAGDCSQMELGISEQDRKLLANEVTNVFHVAATVRFDEKLKQAVTINVRGTSELLKMCKEMTRLRSFVHVSTAYSNCAQDVVEEMFYPTPIEPKNLIVLVNSVEEQILDDISPKILKSFPNTYAFTKAVAEQVIRDEGGSLPVAIYRPSVVISTYKEPIPGWINNLYGPTGVTAGAAGGILRSLHCDRNVNANVVPADMCVNCLIAIPWEVEEKFNLAKQTGTAYDVPIYQYESSTEQPITWGQYMDLAERCGQPYPSLNVLWYYSFTLHKNLWVHHLATLFLHLLPALLVDGALFCAWKKPRFVKIYQKIHRFANVLSYFSTKNFRFKSTRMRALLGKMSSEDQTRFFFDLKKLDWNEFMRTYMIGVRVYLMKDPLDTLDLAVKRFNRLGWCHQIFKYVIYFITLRMAWALAKQVYELCL